MVETPTETLFDVTVIKGDVTSDLLVDRILQEPLKQLIGDPLDGCSVVAFKHGL